MRATSSKTTVAGFFAALALASSGIGDALKDGWQMGDVALIVGAVMLAVQAFFTRDKDVTSEGTRVPQ